MAQVAPPGGNAGLRCRRPVAALGSGAVVRWQRWAQVPSSGGSAGLRCRRPVAALGSGAAVRWQRWG